MALNFLSITTITNVSVSQQALGGNSIYTTSTGFFGTYSYVHVFTSSGIFTATTSLNIAFLVVGGGGGGNQYSYGGGGGAGGVVTGTAVIPSSSNYVINVGTGGAGGTPGVGQPSGCNGSASSIQGGTALFILAQGGGGGAGLSPGGTLFNGKCGASGGGSPSASSPGSQIFPNRGGIGSQPVQSQIVASGNATNYGNPGGTSNSTLSGSGGGGAGGAGTGGSGTTPAVPGGAGLASSITGSPVTYAAGGRAGGGGSPVTGITGTNYTGNGGAPGSNAGGPYPGGPGIVVISYSGLVQTVTSSTNVAPYTTPDGYVYTYNTTSLRWILTGLPPVGSTYATVPTLLDNNQTNAGAGYFDLPSGTTVQRPSNPQGGWMRFNTDLNSVEYYSTITSWTSLPFRP